MCALVPRRPDVGASNSTEHGRTTPVPLLELRPGTRLGGYEVEEVVGRGGMGVVYRARHVHLARTAALKVLAPELAADDGFRERFLRESRIAASLLHPHVVTVYDAGDADGLLYIAMQYVQGSDLAELLQRDSPLEPLRAVALLGQVADALDAAHALGLVHRDVKPANIVLAGESAYLTDFGLTKHRSSRTALTEHGAFLGTATYAAPEQVEGRPVDGRTDVYALGCVLFQALAGAPPFERESEISVAFAQVQHAPPRVSELRPELPPALDAVVAKALAKAPGDRWSTCGELVAAARAALGGGGPTVATAAPRRSALVADASPGVRAVARLTLEEAGFDVVEGTDAHETLETARRGRIDLAVVGWEILATAGADAADVLRAAGATVLAVVPRAAALTPAEVQQAGPDAYVESPFSSIQLRYAMDEVLPAATS